MEKLKRILKKPDVITKSINWVEIKNKCRTTVGKAPTSNVPSSTFKTNVLIAEHSPIREGWIKWTWDGIKSWVSVHFARHWLGWNKYISTQRDDRTDNTTSRDDAPQSTPVKMDVSADMQALINVARFRLCYQASPETREYEEGLKIAVKYDVNEPELSDVMVPNCIYRGGCPETFGMCKQKLWLVFIDWCDKNNKPINTIKERYSAYNEFFYSSRKGE